MAHIRSGAYPFRPLRKFTIIVSSTYGDLSVGLTVLVALGLRSLDSFFLLLLAVFLLNTKVSAGVHVASAHLVDS